MERFRLRGSLDRLTIRLEAERNLFQHSLLHWRYYILDILGHGSALRRKQ